MLNHWPCGSFVVSILRNSQTISQSCFIIDIITRDAWGFQAPHIPLTSIFFYLAIFMGGKCFLIMVLICIFLVNENMQGSFFFPVGLEQSTYHHWWHVCSAFSPLFNRVVFLLFRFKRFLFYVSWIEVPYWTHDIQIFSLSVASFKAFKVLILIKSQLSTFLFYGQYFWPPIYSILSDLLWLVLALTPRSMIHREITIMFGVRWGFTFIHSHVDT